VAAGEQAGEHPLEHLVLPGDHASDLEEGSLQHFLRLLGLVYGRLLGAVGHASSFDRVASVKHFLPESRVKIRCRPSRLRP
jgi:hypothetical protein